MKNSSPVRNTGKQFGFLLLEVAVGTVLLGIVAMTQLREQAEKVVQQVAAAQGGQLKGVSEALNTYITNYYPNIIANTAVPGVATVRQPTVAELKGLGLLPASFSNTAINGGNYLTSLTLIPAACTPPACNVTGYVSIDRPLLINNAFSPSAMDAALREMGANGGVASIAGATISGRNGSWSIANPVAGTPQGTMAMLVGSGTSEYSEFLRRDGSLAMVGGLDMGGNQISNVSKLSITTVAVVDGACTTGDIGRDATGALLNCVGGVWKVAGGSASWADAVATYVALPVCNAAASGVTRVVITPSVGSGPRAYTCNGATWVAQALDDSGNITVPGTLTASGGVKISNGSAGAPAIAFVGDPNSGIYWVGADQVGISAGGVTSITATTAGATITGDATVSGKVMAGAGSAAAPSHSFSAVQNKGMYDAGGNAVGISAAGVNRLTVDTTGAAVTGNVAASGNINATGSLSAASATVSGVVSAGSLSTVGSVSAGSGSISGTLNAGNLTIAGSQVLSAANSAYAYNMNQYVRSTDSVTFANVTSAGKITAGKLQVNDVVTANTACSPDGLIAKDSTGLLLSCQSGLWKDQSSGVGGTVRAFAQFNGAAASCPGGVCTLNTSSGISSVIRNGVGDYTINFSSAMPSANFAVLTNTSLMQYPLTWTTSVGVGYTRTTTSIRMKAIGSGASVSDVVDASVVIIQ